MCGPSGSCNKCFYAVNHSASPQCCTTCVIKEKAYKETFCQLDTNSRQRNETMCFKCLKNRGFRDGSELEVLVANVGLVSRTPHRLAYEHLPQLPAATDSCTNVACLDRLANVHKMCFKKSLKGTALGLKAQLSVYSPCLACMKP